MLGTRTFREGAVMIRWLGGDWDAYGCQCIMPYLVELVSSRLECNSVKNVVVGMYNTVCGDFDCVHLM